MYTPGSLTLIIVSGFVTPLSPSLGLCNFSRSTPGFHSLDLSGQYAEPMGWGEPKFCPGCEVRLRRLRQRTTLNYYDQGLTPCLASTMRSRCNEGSTRRDTSNRPSLELGVVGYCHGGFAG